jgi:hypothetical protein
MIWQIAKWGITAGLVVAISSLSKKYTLVSSLLASLPLVSLLAMTWMHIEGQDVETINQFSIGVFWMVLPSLPMFIIFPKLMEKMSFPLSMGCVCTLTILLYLLMLKILIRLNI